MAGINVIDAYREDSAISQYDGVLWCVNWLRPYTKLCPKPVTLWRFLNDPEKTVMGEWTAHYLPECNLAVFANEPDIEGAYPGWYDERVAEWQKAGGKVVEPAYHDERNYKPDSIAYDVRSWHCYAGDFSNRDALITRSGGTPIIGTEYARPGNQVECLRDLQDIPEQVYLFAWEWPQYAPNPAYTLRGVTLTPTRKEPAMSGNVVIQAGHVNIASNIDAGLRGETGATHAGNALAEQEITSYVARRSVQLLMDAGVGAEYADANYNGAPGVSLDHNAVVAIHAQSNPPDQSGWDVGVGDPTQDGAAAASHSLFDALAANYEAATGLPRQSWCQGNPNVQDYYLFRALTRATPFALIELCNTDVDWDWAHSGDHLDRMAYGVANGVLGFLGRATLAIPDNAAPVPVAPQAPETLLQALNNAVTAVNTVRSELESALTAAGKL